MLTKLSKSTPTQLVARLVASAGSAVFFAAYVLLFKKPTTATRRDQRGFSSLEWALIAAGVVAIAAIIIAAIGGAVQEALNNI